MATKELFASPPWLAHEREANYRCYSKLEKGHGRLEKRTLESSPALREYMQEYLNWPGGQQVMRRTCRRVILSSGEISEEVKYGVTSLRWEEADAHQLERLWREHWTIENRVHYVRDVTMGEDQNQMRVGNAPQVLAALHNAILNLIRSKGWTNIADGLRHCATMGPSLIEPSLSSPPLTDFDTALCLTLRTTSAIVGRLRHQNGGAPTNAAHHQDKSYRARRH